MKVAWFTPVRDGAIVGYSRGVLAAMVRLCEPHLFCDGPPDRFPAGVPVADLAARPQALSDLPSFDAVFYNLGNDVRQHAWIFDIARLHPGIVVLHDLTLHRFFLDYYLQHLRRPDLYVTRMAEHYGITGLTTAHRVLGPWFDPEDARVDDDDLLRYTFTEEALRSASGVVVHSRWHGAIVRTLWRGPVCEASLPAQRASASSGARDYAREVLRFAEQDAWAAGAEPLAHDASRAVAERIAIQIGETLASLGVTPDSPGVDAVIREARSLLWPLPG